MLIYYFCIGIIVTLIDLIKVYYSPEQKAEFEDCVYSLQSQGIPPFVIAVISCMIVICLWPLCVYGWFKGE